MEETPHVLLSGDGVQSFAEKYGFPLEKSLHTPQAWEALEAFKKQREDPSVTEIGCVFSYL